MVFANGRLHLRGRDGIRCVPRIAVVRGAGTCAVTASCNFFFRFVLLSRAQTDTQDTGMYRRFCTLNRVTPFRSSTVLVFVCRSAPLPPLAGLNILCLFKPLPQSRTTT